MGDYPTWKHLFSTSMLNYGQIAIFGGSRDHLDGDNFINDRLIIFDPKTEEFRKVADFDAYNFRFDLNQAFEVSPGKVIMLARKQTQDITATLIIEWTRTKENVFQYAK